MIGVAAGGDALGEGVILSLEYRADSAECRRSAKDVIGEVGICWISAAEYRRSVIGEIGFSWISGFICKGVAWLKFDMLDSEKLRLFPTRLGIGASARKIPCSAE